MNSFGTARESWTDADDAFLRENYASMRTEAIGARLERTPVAVTLRARKLGLSKPRGAFGTSWSAAEDAFLRENYERMPIRQIAESLRRSYQATTVRAGKLDVRTGTKVPWTKAEDDYLRANRAAMTASRLAADLGRPWPSVRTRVRALGLTNDKNEAKLVRRAAIRHDYFSRVDSPLKAYVLGWMASDGYITKNEVRIGLNSKDAHIVSLIRDELAPLHELNHRMTGAGNKSPQTLLRLGSPRMKGDLARWGIVAAKSLIIRYPPELAPDLDGSFILGYFDGNGSLSTYDPNKTGRLYWRWQIVSGSSPLLEEIRSRIFTNTGILVCGPIKHRGSEAHAIYTSGSKVAPVDAWLHADLPGLARKSLSVRETAKAA